MELDDGNVAYLLGRGGQTRARLSAFSGASLEISRGKAEMWGTPSQIELTTLSIDITLQQRNGGKIRMDFTDLEEREDISTTEVPLDCVGFVLGAKGATLRTLETRFKTFMFFDNERVRNGHKRLYIVSPNRECREAAIKETDDVVRYKVTGESRWQGGRGGGRGRSPPRYRQRSYSRSRSPRRSYSPRRRSYSRSRSPPRHSFH